jgi:hypothetical protein
MSLDVFQIQISKILASSSGPTTCSEMTLLAGLPKMVDELGDSPSRHHHLVDEQ